MVQRRKHAKDLSDSDFGWMKEAIDLGRRGEGWTRPNPPVGAVVVKNGQRVGHGYHRMAGKPHAEVVALRAAGEQAKGADLFVTLEPCSTQGRTPPCTALIKQSGISRVVVSVPDPNPCHRGRGLRILRRAGIAVVSGVCAEEGRELITPFATWVTSGRPHVTLKMAMTLDGRIADAQGRSRWITSPASRAYVDDLRRRADVVMVGSGTASADDPSLLCRKRKSSHYRLVVDSRGKISAKLRLLSDTARDKTIIATTDQCPEARRRSYCRAGSEVLILPGRGEHVSLRSLFSELGKRGILHVLCEGGAGLAHALIRAELVDECWFFVAPKVIGSERALAAVSGKGWPLSDAPEFRFVDVKSIGEDVLLRAVPCGRTKEK